MTHEWDNILWEFHAGVVGGHVGGKATSRKVLQDGLWWPSLFKDAKEYVKGCDIFQQVGRPSRQDEMPLHLVRALEAFEKWQLISLD